MAREIQLYQHFANDNVFQLLSLLLNIKYLQDICGEISYTADSVTKGMFAELELECPGIFPSLLKIGNV